MGRTRVVNIRKESCDAIIGRAGIWQGRLFRKSVQAGSNDGKGSTLDRYREIFYHRLSTDEKFARRIGNLQAGTLGCFGNRILVMGDIIKRILGTHGGKYE